LRIILAMNVMMRAAGIAIDRDAGIAKREVGTRTA
jgi:hypothetical protein